MYSLKYCHQFQKIYKEYNFEQNKIRLACVFLKNEAFIVDEKDDVWHFLNNRPRKLVDICKQIVKEFHYCYNKVNDVTAYYAIVLLENGDVYGWGEDNYNLLSDKKVNDFYKLRKKEFQTHPYIMLHNKSKSFSIKFDTIAVGQRHCIGVTKHNRLVLWGDNTHGQLGTDSIANTNTYNLFEVNQTNQILTKIETYLRPSNDFLENSYLKLASFFGYEIDENKIYQECTRNVDVDVPGERVTLNQVIEAQPRINVEQHHQVIDHSEQNGHKIKQIACGSYHSLVLLSCGDLYGFGSNSSGQLGILPQASRKQPTIILQHIKQVVSTALHTLALKNDGTVLAMGDNSYAQLGRIKPVLSSIPLEINLTFVEISTINGLSMGKDKNGSIYCWGYWGTETENLDSDINSNENNESNLTHSTSTTRSDSRFNNVDTTKETSCQNAVLSEPKRVFCTNFEEVVARRFSITHFAITGNDYKSPVNEKPYLIDPISVSILKEIEEIEAENLVNRVNFNDQEIEVLKSRVDIVEKRPNIHIAHYGDKITSSLIGGLVVTDSSPSINISGSSATGKIG